MDVTVEQWPRDVSCDVGVNVEWKKPTNNSLHNNTIICASHAKYLQCAPKTGRVETLPQLTLVSRAALFRNPLDTVLYGITVFTWLDNKFTINAKPTFSSLLSWKKVCAGWSASPAAEISINPFYTAFHNFVMTNYGPPVNWHSWRPPFAANVFDKHSFWRLQ